MDKQKQALLQISGKENHASKGKLVAPPSARQPATTLPVEVIKKPLVTAATHHVNQCSFGEPAIIQPAKPASKEQSIVVQKEPTTQQPQDYKKPAAPAKDEPTVKKAEKPAEQ